jgi:signal transduction histidine kinase
VKLSIYICLLCLLAVLQLKAQDHVINQDHVIGNMKESLWLQPDSTSYIDVLNRIGLRYHLSNTDSCFLYAVNARAIAERRHYKRGIADALNTLSIFYALKANMKQAVDYDYRALLLYRQLSDSSNICQVLMNISVYHQFTGMDHEGKLSLAQAMDIGSRLPEEKDSIYTLVLINYTLRYYGDSTHTDSVRWAIHKAEEIAKRYPDSREMYYLQAFEAMDRAQRGKDAQALADINELAMKAEEEGLIYVSVDLYSFLAAFYEKHYTPQVLSYLKHALVLAEKGGYTDLMQPAIASLYKYNLAHGDKTAAAVYGKMIWELTDRQTRMKNDRTVNYLDYFLREQELSEWTLQNKLQEEKIADANLMRTHRQWLISCLLAVLLLLTGITISRYRSYRNLRQQERMLANMNVAISEKNGQLRAHDDFKNTLISILAHDFREPLNNIIAVSELFRDEGADREVMQETIDKAEASSIKTLGVFDGILRWIKSQLSGFVYSPAPCHLQEQFNNTISGIGNTIAPNLVVAGDHEMLQFVHRNLLRYACSKSDNVTIQAVKAADEICVKITVPAPTMSPEMAAKLFEHHEDDDAFTLVICKDFMDKMGGKIWAVVNNGMLTMAYTLPSFY